MEEYEERKLIAEAETFKRIAFLGIAVSTVATLTAIIAVPMLYNYIQRVQSGIKVKNVNLGAEK